MMTTPPERDPAIEHLRTVSDLLEECAEPPMTDERLTRLIVLLLVVVFFWLLSPEGRSEENGPEWSGATHVDGRG